MTKKFSFDVFLSHNSRDKARVRRLAERLKRARLRVWFDEWIIKPGDDIYLAIERGLEAARVQVLCLSPAALGSDWVALERSTVLFRDPSNVDRRFIPLLLADCELPDALRRYKYVDFRQEENAAFEELLNACRPEEAQEDLPPQEVEKAHPPLPTKPKAKSKSKKQPEQTAPLAMLKRKLTGHKSWVRSVAVSPDGKWAASGSQDKTVKIWDLETGRCQATLAGHTDQVICIAITPDGQRVISGSYDNDIRVWDVQSSRLLACWRASEHMVISLVLLSDGKRLISGGAGLDPNLKIWDIGTEKCLMTLKGHQTTVKSICLAKNEKQIISGSADNTLKLW